jgi:hypothetical protein
MMRNWRCAFVLHLAFALLPATSQAQLLFRDEFDGDGGPVTWGIGGGGSREFTGGDYVFTVGGGGDSFVRFINNYGDVSIQTQLRVLEKTGHVDAYLYSRASADRGTLYAGGIRDDGLLELAAVTDGVTTRAVTSESTLDPVAQDLILKLSTFGDQISLTAWQLGAPESAITLSFTDGGIERGGIGIFVNGYQDGPPSDKVAFRWFEALPEPSTILTTTIGSLLLATTRRRPQNSR